MAEPITCHPTGTDPIPGKTRGLQCVTCGKWYDVFSRPDWTDYFLGIAFAVSARADCRRQQFGCVIVNQNRIVATGYNGAPSGKGSCLAGDCPRGLLDKKAHPGFMAGNQDFSNCIALHCEQNAITYASREETMGSTVYIWDLPPCDMCKKLLTAAGVHRVVWPSGQLWLDS